MANHTGKDFEGVLTGENVYELRFQDSTVAAESFESLSVSENLDPVVLSSRGKVDTSEERTGVFNFDELPENILERLYCYPKNGIDFGVVVADNYSEFKLWNASSTVTRNVLSITTVDSTGVLFDHPPTPIILPPEIVTGKQ